MVSSNGTSSSFISCCCPSPLSFGCGKAALSWTDCTKPACAALSSGSVRFIRRLFSRLYYLSCANVFPLVWCTTKTGQTPASELHKIQPATSQLNKTQSLPTIRQLSYLLPISNVSPKPTSTQSASHSETTHLGTPANIKQVYIIQQPVSGPNNSQ